jgi:hypothetical protein
MSSSKRWSSPELTKYGYLSGSTVSTSKLMERGNEHLPILRRRTSGSNPGVSLYITFSIE